MSDLPPPIADFVRAHPECAPAVDFVRRFQYQEGVDYEWLEGYAKGQYEFMAKVFDDLDAKAAALVNLIGGSTGLLTVGSVAAAASSQLNVWVVVSALPAIVFAFVAFLSAIYSRATHPVHHPPETDKVAEWAAYYGKEPSRARAALVPQWHLCTELMRPVVNKKADLVESATLNFARALGLLALPLIAAVAQRMI